MRRTPMDMSPEEFVAYVEGKTNESLNQMKTLHIEIGCTYPMKLLKSSNSGAPIMSHKEAARIAGKDEKHVILYLGSPAGQEALAVQHHLDKGETDGYLNLPTVVCYWQYCLVSAATAGEMREIMDLLFACAIEGMLERCKYAWDAVR